MFRSLVILELLAFFLSFPPLAVGQDSPRLAVAVFRGDIKVIQELLESGADVNEADAFGSTPLMVAILAQKPQIATYLLAHGADPNLRRPQSGSTALRHAVLANRSDLVRLLLNARASVNLKYPDGQTLLHLAAVHSSAEIIDLLCSRGAEVNELNATGNSALDEAVLKGKSGNVSALLRQKVDARRVHPGTGRGPLHEACIKGFASVVPLLAGAGVDPTLPDESGQTPLDLALDYQNTQVAAALLVLVPQFPGLRHDFEHAMELAVQKGVTTTVSMLLDCGWDVNRRTSRESSYINDAALKGQVKIVRLLLDRGARVDSRNASGGTALHDAALAGNAAVLGMLLDQGALLDARETESGATPLMLAASLGHTEAVDLLLKRGANPSLKDDRGRTALSRAREGQEPALVKLLEDARTKPGASSQTS